MRVLYLVMPVFFALSCLQRAEGGPRCDLPTQDTILLTVDKQLNKYLLHVFRDGQSLQDVCDQFGVRLSTLTEINPAYASRPPQAGEDIRIPIAEDAVLRERPIDFATTDYALLFYRVEPGDNLFRISKYYFQLSMDTLMHRSGMSSPESLQIGQLLQVGWLAKAGSWNPPAPRVPRKIGYRPDNLDQMRRFEQQVTDMSRQVRAESGVAYWQRGSQDESAVYLALHREAPKGSVVEVHNPMSGKYVYLKVVGTIPATRYGDEVVVVISAKAAKVLGARDPRFFVQVRYAK